MRKKLQLALIGTGMAALPHAKALSELGDVIDVRGVWSRDEQKRMAFAKQWGFPAYASYDALMADDGLTAALIITPPNARADLVKTLAAAGKHILMEKPVERTTAAAEALVACCLDAGVKLGIVFQHRFRKASEALMLKIRSGELGALHVVQANVPWWRDQAYYDEPGRGSHERDGGGVLISQAIHTLDLMLSMTGPVVEVQAMAATTPFHRMESEDFVAGALRFAADATTGRGPGASRSSGAVGSLMATTAAFPGQAESLVFGFSNATACLASGTLTIDWFNGRSETVGEPSSTGGGADPMAFPHEWHRDLIADFADAVATDRDPRTTGREALNVHRLIDALLRSSADGKLTRV